MANRDYLHYKPIDLGINENQLLGYLAQAPTTFFNEAVKMTEARKRELEAEDSERRLQKQKDIADAIKEAKDEEEILRRAEKVALGYGDLSLTASRQKATADRARKDMEETLRLANKIAINDPETANVLYRKAGRSDLGMLRKKAPPPGKEPHYNIWVGPGGKTKVLSDSPELEAQYERLEATQQGYVPASKVKGSSLFGGSPTPSPTPTPSVATVIEVQRKKR